MLVLDNPVTLAVKHLRSALHVESLILVSNKDVISAGLNCSKNLEASVNAIEELESTAKLALILRGMGAIELNQDQINSVVNKFNIDWD